MLFKCSWAFFVLSVVCVIFPSALRAQVPYAISYRFEVDTVVVQKNQTFANRLIVENLLEKEVILKADAKQTNALKGLLKLPDFMVLKKGEKRSFPLKYLADGRTIVQKKQAFTVALKSETDQQAVQPEASFFTKLTEEQAFSLSTAQTDYYLDQATAQVQVMVQAMNTSLVPVNFRLQFSEVPEGLEFTGDFMLSTLEPGAQALLPFTIRNNRKQRITDFEVIIQSLDEKGRRLASRRIRVISAGSVRRFETAGALADGASNNRLALKYVSMSSNSSVYQAQGYGQLPLGDSTSLDYRFNVDYYHQLGGVNLYDTYLDYRARKWGVKVGNIYENLDYTVSGKGVQGSYHFDRNKRLRVFAVDNDYLLFSIQRNRIARERILAADYAFKLSHSNDGRLTFLNSDDKYTGVRSNQLSAKVPLVNAERQQLQLEGGYSLSHAGDADDKHAFAIGANYTYQSDAYQFATNQYFSSPYYIGLRRGLVQSDSRLVRKLDDSKSVSARLSFMRVDPKYLASEESYRFDSRSQINIAEFGYRMTLGSFVTELKPYYMGQTLDNELSWKSKSMRAAVNLSYFKERHRFNINMDYGYTFENSANRPVAPFHSLRMNASYDHRYFGWTSYAQLNPYYLSDLYASPDQDSDYYIYSFGPNTNFSAFNNRLNVQLSAIYNVYGFSQTRNLSVNGNAVWKLKGMWNLTADVFMTRMDNQLFNSEAFLNRQLRFGIEKKFNTNVEHRRRNLALTYFEDLNNNGRRDDRESTIEGVLVQIDNQSAITDKNGRVQFQNMKDGAYDVAMVNSKGWTTNGHMSVMVNKNKSLEVPLVKTAILKGEIQLAGNRYEDSRPSFSGIKINAVDGQGKTYNTLSDAAGNYTLYLPPSDYSVFIDTEGMSFSIENRENAVQLKDGDGVKTLNFTYKDNRRKVDVKKF